MANKQIDAIAKKHGLKPRHLRIITRYSASSIAKWRSDPDKPATYRKAPLQAALLLRVALYIVQHTPPSILARHKCPLDLSPLINRNTLKGE